MSSHTCHAEGCTQQIRPKLLACAPHWRMVPVHLQAAVWKTYKPGQEVRKDPSPAYLLVQTRCRVAIAEAEGRDTTALRAELARRCDAVGSGGASGDPVVLADMMIRAIMAGGR